ncbi:MAG TPA: condensation domain-containing protein, partial [Chthonomonadaceae bacterium]|nr:condensation domain-containing protein [Chthonomonadaceae bacterium]
GSGSGALESGELRSFLKERLPEYMVPVSWVWLEALPLTSNGKVDRKALPAPKAKADAADYVAPRTSIEEGLAEIWSEVLHLDRVGVHTNFFELGGHSLLAIQLIARLEARFDIAPSLRTLFEYPTIAELAEQVVLARQAGAGVQPPPIVRVDRNDLIPLSFAQQRLWFIEQLQPGNAVYNIPHAIRIRGPLHVPAFRQALDEIVARHEALRTNFVEHEGEGIQVISAEMGLPFQTIDLRDKGEAEREQEALELCTIEARRPFDLSRDRLIRALWITVGEEDHILVLTMHHIVSDGVSSNILFRELTTLYAAFKAEQPSPLSPLPVQYADYAAWQRHWLQGDNLERQAAYWRSQLHEAPPRLNLPTDRPEELAHTHRSGMERTSLSPDVAQQLHSLSLQARASLFMTLLAAFNVLLYHYTNQRDIVIGTDDAGRNHAALEGLIGFFINHLVLRTDLSGDPTFRELLQRVRQMTLDAYTHADMPFDKLVELLQPDRTSSHTPLFQVLFVMQQQSGANPAFDADLELHAVPMKTPTSKYDIVLFATHSPKGLAFTWLYRTELFDASTIQGMAADFESLLCKLVSAPEIPLSECKSLLLDNGIQRSAQLRDQRRLSLRERLRPGASRT